MFTIVLVRRFPSVAAFDCIWLRITRREAILFWLLPLGIVVAVACTALPILRIGLPLRKEVAFAEGYDAYRNTAFLAWMAVYSGLLFPVTEEIFWRGYVQSTLLRICHPVVAVSGQAILFGLIHFKPVMGFLQASLIGLVFGLWCYRRKTLMPVILMHIFFNSALTGLTIPDWIEMRQIKDSHDYVAEFLELSEPANYDPNDDAREDYTKAIQSVVEFPEELREAHRSYPTQWSREEREQAEAWVISNTEALEHVEKGAKKSNYWLEYEHKDSTVLSVLPRNLDKFRHLAFALCMRAEMRTSQGELEQGFSDVMCCYQLGRHLLRNKTLISKLVAFAVIDLSVKTEQMILSNEEIEPMLLTRIQEQLETFAKSIQIDLDFIEERFICLDVIQRIFTDDGHGGGHIPRSAFKKRIFPKGEFESAISNFAFVSESDIRVWRRLERHSTTADVKQYYDLAEEACLMSPWEYNKRFNFIKISIEIIKNRNPLIKTFSPAIDRLVEMKTRWRTNLEALITTLAILRYKADTQRLPVSLSELVAAGYLKTIPVDPYNNGALIYRRSDNDFLLYSFGADFDDDGGTPSKWGDGPKGGDQVFWPVRDSEPLSVDDNPLGAD
jgi:membrane protease YdiL (CAAX protease family)